MQQRGVVHPNVMAVVVAQNEASIVFTKPRVVLGDGTVTPETALAAQTVRISYDDRALVALGVAGQTPVLNAKIYAVTGMDIAEGYTFTHQSNRFRVTDVIPALGGIQAICLAIG